ncbi:unnamed protein product [Amoebophrya sp. A25]|nr:unnamed protein product [Amoebophrya sp. A25]|eukprot:GSA25T00001641001.1
MAKMKGMLFLLKEQQGGGPLTRASVMASLMNMQSMSQAGGVKSQGGNENAGASFFQSQGGGGVASFFKSTVGGDGDADDDWGDEDDDWGDDEEGGGWLTTVFNDEFQVDDDEMFTGKANIAKEWNDETSFIDDDEQGLADFLGDSMISGMLTSMMPGSVAQTDYEGKKGKGKKGKAMMKGKDGKPMFMMKGKGKKF